MSTIDGLPHGGVLRDGLNTWGVRLHMAARGWIGDLRLDGDGFCRIWFSRWDWHGRPCDRVTMHAGTRVSPGNPSSAVPMIAAAARRAAARALDAWERFPGSVPMQTADGGLREEPTATGILFRRNVSGSADQRPTEALPSDPRRLLDADPGTDPTVGAALAVAARGFGYEDSFTHVGRNPPRAILDRDWGLDMTISVTRWHGIRVRPQRFRSSVDTLLETFAARAVEGSLGAVDGLLVRYRPGGPHGDLPPGMETHTTPAGTASGCAVPNDEEDEG